AEAPIQWKSSRGFSRKLDGYARRGTAGIGLRGPRSIHSCKSVQLFREDPRLLFFFDPRNMLSPRARYDDIIYRQPIFQSTDETIRVHLLDRGSVRSGAANPDVSPIRNASPAG